MGVLYHIDILCEQLYTYTTSMKLKDFVKSRTLEKEYKKLHNNVECGVCQDITDCYSDVISDTFTNLDQLSTHYICKECSCLFADSWRKSAFYINKKECKKIQQKEFEDILFNAHIVFPCILSFSESRKKHRLFRSKISYSPLMVYVSTDDGEVVFNIEQDKELFFYLSELYNSYKLSKSWLEAGEWPTNVIPQVGLEKYLEYREKVKKHVGTAKLHLIINFLNKHEQEL